MAMTVNSRHSVYVCSGSDERYYYCLSHSRGQTRLLDVVSEVQLRSGVVKRPILSADVNERGLCLSYD